MMMQPVKGFLVVLWSLLPLILLFCLNLYLIPHYQCENGIDGLCKPGYRAVLFTNSDLPYGALLTGKEVQLKITLVKDITKMQSLHSSTVVKGKYLLSTLGKDAQLSAENLGSVKDVIDRLPKGTLIIPIARGNATGLTSELTAKFVPKSGTDKDLKAKHTLQQNIYTYCPQLKENHKILTVLDIPLSKHYLYLAIKDTLLNDWINCYGVLKVEDLMPLIVPQYAGQWIGVDFSHQVADAVAR
jgi:hypothetical protein